MFFVHVSIGCLKLKYFNYKRWITPTHLSRSQLKILNYIENTSVERICEVSTILMKEVNIIIIFIYTANLIHFSSFIHIFNEILYLLGELQNPMSIICGYFNIRFNPAGKNRDRIMDIL